MQDILGKDWTHRKQALLDYGAFVHAGNETPLSAFAGGTDPASAAQFKGKAALVFHLLKTMIKEEAFSRAVAKLSEEQPSGQLSWDDIRVVFEKESGQDLGWFFTQWIGRKGLPDLHAENPDHAKERQQVRSELRGAPEERGIYPGPARDRILPAGRSTTEKIRLDEERKKITLTFDDEPLSLVIDRDYDLPRHAH